MRFTSVEMIEKLVGFDTTSRNSNLELIHFVRDYLDAHGVASEIVPNEDGRKANLYATVGPMVDGGVVLSGHTDVVPVDDQPWDTDPFTIVEKDGKLFGRGTCDMKSFSAIGLALVPEMLASDMKRPIHFALSYDEETGCFGAPLMIEQMAEKLPKAQAVIVGEPSMMEIVRAHKGSIDFRTTVIGHEAHSSQMHRGVSAVMTASRLITFLEDMMLEKAANADPANGFEPPYSTLHVGKVQGGTAGNIISRQCDFVWEIRNVPEDDPQEFISRFEAKCAELKAAMQKIAPECDIVTEMNANVPALMPEVDGAAEALCRHLSGKNSSGVVAYATEGGQFQEGGYSTIICGPGSIDQAHQPNEFIALDQVWQCELFLRKLIDYQAA